MKYNFLLISTALVLIVALSFCHKNEEPVIPPPITPEEEFGPELDSFDLLTGVYAGLRVCGQFNSTTTVTVKRHQTKEDHLIIGDQAVYIDLDCQCFPNLSVGNYRIYHAWFRNDSLFLNIDSGSLNQPNLCKYYLKKQ